MFTSENQKALSELCRLCIELSRDDFHAFFTFSPHVKQATVYVYAGGWSEGTIWDYHESFYCDSIEAIEAEKERLMTIFHNRNVINETREQEREIAERNEYERLKTKYGEAA